MEENNIRHAEKLQRQYCINFLERAAKKIFKMFRNPNTSEQKYIDWLTSFTRKLAPYNDIVLHAEYHKTLKDFILTLERDCKISGFFTTDYCTKGMTALNRLQKMKNADSFKRKKRHITE